MSVLPRIALFLQYVLPRNSRNTQNLLAVYSPTDCTDLHRTFLLYILPQIAQIYTEPSCCMFSHGIHGIHRTFLLYVLPRNSRNTQNLLAVYSPTEFTEHTEPSCSMFSHRFHRFTQNLLAVYSPTDCTDYHRCCFQGVHLSQVHQPVLLVYFLLCWCT